MMSQPAHLNLTHPAGQIVNPIGADLTLADYIRKMNGVDDDASNEIAAAARELALQAGRYADALGEHARGDAALGYCRTRLAVAIMAYTKADRL